MKRKRYVGVWGILLFSIAVTIGCSSTSSNQAEIDAAVSSGEITPGGELKWALGGVLAEDNLDAHRSGNAQNGRVARSIYDSLVVELENGEVKPWLAKSWEISEDHKSYTFQLREDVTFHDGSVFNAEVVKFNFDRIKDPKTKATNSLNQIGPYQSAEVLDEFTVKLNFEQPFAPFLSNLAKADLGIVSKEAVEKYGDEFLYHPIGTGPFKLEKLTKGTEVVLVKNEDYQWAPENAGHQGPAYLDKLTIQFVPEEASRIGVLESKQVHVADIIPPQNLVLLQENEEFNVIEEELKQINYTFYLNPSKEPWDNLNVRKAIRSALDIQTAVQTVYLGTSEQAWSPITPQMFAYTDTVENTWQPDIEQTEKLFAEAGYTKNAQGVLEKDGQPLTIDFIEYQGNREKRLDIMTIFQQQLKKVGVQLNILSLSYGAYMEKRIAGDYDALAESQYAGDPDVLRYNFSTKGPSGETNIARANTKELDDLLEQGALEQGREKRAEIYREAQEYIIENVYAIPTYLFNYSFATVKEVNGVRFHSPAFPDFYDAWIYQE